MSLLKRPGTAVDETLETIRERILSGAYAPGMRISQQQLAEELEVSRTPLREALQRLTHEGLVISRTNRGMEVAPASSVEVEGSYYLRLLIEPATISAVTPSVTDADVALMEQNLAKMDEPLVSTRDFQEAHLGYHNVLLHRYPKASAELTQELHTQIHRYQRLYFGRPVAVADFTWLDRIFLQAVKQRDGELARHILEFHLLDAAVGLLLEADPAHSFEVLKVGIQALNMEVVGLGEPGAVRPYTVRWHKEQPAGLPDLKTSNLAYVND